MPFWLFFLLPVTVVTGPLNTPERVLNLSEDIIQVQPHPEQNSSKIGTVNTTDVLYEWSSTSGHLMEEVPCVHQQLQLNVLRDILLSLYDGWSQKRELGKVELAQLGICSHSESAQYSQFSSLFLFGQNVLTESNNPRCLHIQKEHWEFQEDGIFKTTLQLTKPFKFDHQNTMASIILIFFVDSSNTEELIISFSSHILQPNKQTVCVSKDTHFLVLTGVQPESFNQGHLKLTVLVETQTEGKKMGLSEIQAIMERRDLCNITLNPVFLFFTPRIDSNNVLRSNSTFLFLCELQKFLNEVLPHRNPSVSQNEVATVRPDALHSLPPLILGESTSESLLQELVNSSGPTVFFFPYGSQGLRTHRVELALKPALLSVLKIRLDEALAQVQMEEAGRNLMDKLQILSVLSTLPKDGEGWITGLDNPHEVQYRAVLLLKALQAVLNAWAIERAQRAARADQETSTRPSECHLQSFTVSLHKFLLQPETANINNCEGTCGFPLRNGNNHAILLNSYLQSGLPLNRTLCCVPVDYDDLCVIELNSDSTVISYKTNMVAKECGCR